MNTVLSASLVVITSVFVASISQVILKSSANEEQNTIWQMFVNKKVFFAYFLLFLTTFVNVIVYKNLTVTLIVILETLGYIFVPTISYFALKEEFSRNQIIGSIIIILGILIYSI